MRRWRWNYAGFAIQARGSWAPYRSPRRRCWPRDDDRTTDLNLTPSVAPCTTMAGGHRASRRTGARGVGSIRRLAPVLHRPPQGQLQDVALDRLGAVPVAP